MTDDLWHTVSTAPAAPVPTLESVKAAMAAARAIPRPEHDCVVATRAVWDRLVLTTTPAVIPESPLLAGCSRLDGLPVHVRETVEEARLLAKELTDTGRRPLLVDGTKEAHPCLPRS